MANSPGNDTPLYRITVSGKDGFINNRGDIVVEPRFQQCLLMKYGRSVFREGDKFGVIDDRGDVVSPAVWDSADLCYQDGLLLVFRDGKFGYLDRDGRVAIEPCFESAQFFIDAHAPAVPAGESYENGGLPEEGLWGYIDKRGEFTIPPQFAWAGYFSEGVARVGIPEGGNGINGQTRPLNGGAAGKGRHRHGSAADMCVIEFGKFICKAGLRNGVGFIDKRGQPVFDRVFEAGGYFENGLAHVCQRDLWGFIDRTGEFVIPPIFYGTGHSFNEGLTPARFEESWGPWGYIDLEACLVIPPRFLNAGPFEDGLARVTVEEGNGFIDRTGTFVVEPKFVDLLDFSEGLAPAQISREDKCGFIDRTGAFLVPPRFDTVERFQDGLARVNIGGSNCILYFADGGKWGYINRSGDWVWEPSG